MCVCISKEKKDCFLHFVLKSHIFAGMIFFIACCSEIAFLNSVLCSLQYITLKISPSYQESFQQKWFPKHTSMCSFRYAYMWYSRKM